jgi:hypothetical protein
LWLPMRRDAKGGPAQLLLFHNYDRHLECQQVMPPPERTSRDAINKLIEYVVNV